MIIRIMACSSCGFRVRQSMDETKNNFKKIGKCPNCGNDKWGCVRVLTSDGSI